MRLLKKKKKKKKKKKSLHEASTLTPGAATALAKVTGVIVTARVRLRAAAGCKAPPSKFYGV